MIMLKPVEAIAIRADGTTPPDAVNCIVVTATHSFHVNATQ